MSRSGEVVSWRVSHTQGAAALQPLAPPFPQPHPLPPLTPHPPPPPLPPCVPATAAFFFVPHTQDCHMTGPPQLLLCGPWTQPCTAEFFPTPSSRLRGCLLKEAFLSNCLTFTFTQELQINWGWREGWPCGQRGLSPLKFLGR